MSEMGRRVEEYLAVRRSLGHKLDDAARLLPRFAAFLEATGAETVIHRSRSGLGPAAASKPCQSRLPGAAHTLGDASHRRRG